VKAVLAAAVLLLIGVQAGSGAEVARQAARTCPVTLPDRGPGSTIGNSSLTTGAWPHNVVVADARFIQPDGSVRMKFPWWRGTRGELKIGGRRIDAKAPPLRVEIAEGYGLTGLQPTYLIFPTGGCWRISARVGTAPALTFVTLVVKAPHLRPGP
jgi:hypothetical protein